MISLKKDCSKHSTNWKRSRHAVSDDINHSITLVFVLEIALFLLLKMTVVTLSLEKINALTAQIS